MNKIKTKIKNTLFWMIYYGIFSVIFVMFIIIILIVFLCVLFWKIPNFSGFSITEALIFLRFLFASFIVGVIIGGIISCLDE